MIRLHPLTCGWLTAEIGLFLGQGEGKLRVPVPAYLIEHPKGLVLFDSGLHRDLAHEPEKRIGATARVFECEITPEDDVAARLEAIDVDPARVDLLVTSHLHFDHVGGHARLPNAELVVQGVEWEIGLDAERARANHFNPDDYDLGHPVRTVSGEHDVFGDGSVVCLPTHGHTPGHQSLRVRLESGDVVLAADACYLRRTLEEGLIPPIVSDADAMRASLDRLRALRDGGARIFYGHDPEFWQSLPPGPLS
ncbi:MAG: N-acyl homoserine lactonase family protein [Myxococcota bacterium]|nr:N-acyl homoserine lactonase family protein [Myxococcota bacterium]